MEDFPSVKLTSKIHKSITNKSIQEEETKEKLGMLNKSEWKWNERKF